MDDIHSKVLRKFHTLCGVCGMTQDEKKALVESFGVQSSADIDTHDLIDLCNTLSRQADGVRFGRKDRLRKQVMAAIGGYLKKIGHDSNADIIKGIACRSTGYDDFNKIPVERLRNCYHAFVNKQKDIAGAEAVAIALLMAGMQSPSVNDISFKN